MKAPTAHVLTYGCQMNNFDTAMIEERLVQLGFGFQDDWKEADLVVFNTCAIRDKSSERVFGVLGHVKTLKRENPNKVFAVHGCMAAHEPAELKRRAPFVDILIDSNKIEDLITQVEGHFPELSQFVEGAAIEGRIDRAFPDETPYKKFLPIMRGCDFFCTFCVVPYVRGREKSFPPHEIFGRLAQYRDQGVKEVTLLGQNVNSYKFEETRFPDLLVQAAKAFPELKFRYMTSNPWDFSDALVEAMAEFPNVAKHLHLPMQSGSDDVLEAMNRAYTSDQYRDMVERLKARIPDVSLTTDIIAGFPGETEEDHQETLELMQDVRFDNAYMFFYSERDGTPAADFDDQIDLATRKRRLREIIDLQIEHSTEANQRFVGRAEMVLVEGPARKSPNRLVGRLDTNKAVLFDPIEGTEVGSYVPVRIERADAFTLEGVALAGADAEAALA